MWGVWSLGDRQGRKKRDTEIVAVSKRGSVPPGTSWEKYRNASRYCPFERWKSRTFIHWFSFTCDRKVLTLPYFELYFCSWRPEVYGFTRHEMLVDNLSLSFCSCGKWLIGPSICDMSTKGVCYRFPYNSRVSITDFWAEGANSKNSSTYYLLST